MATFSVIIPSYGRPAYLEEAIGSVLTQTIGDFEIIVVDDASPAIVTVPNDPRIRLIRRPTNGGPAAARNTGVEHAIGRYITFLDDDDIYTPDRLQIGLEGVAEAPVGLCWTSPLGEKLARGRLINGVPGGHIVAGTVPHLGSTTVDRKAMRPLNASYRTVEDVEWWIRMSDVPIRTVPQVGYLLRRHSEARVGYDEQERITGSRRLLEEHAAYFSRWPQAAVYRLRWIGLTAMRIDDREAARAAFRQALRTRPYLRDVKHLLSTFVP